MRRRKALSPRQAAKRFYRAKRNHPKNNIFTSIAASGMRGGVRF